ncbi:MAG: 3-hydroxyacyl-CoA dehydrogenase NAD-binding domain-containing protein [Flammeovirgaceae bacterium]
MVKNITSVAVIGAGTMGQGIAQLCAANGYATQLYDLNPNLSIKALENISNGLTNLISKNKISERVKSETLSRLTIAQSLHEIRVDVVIEAVVEKLEVKQKLFVELEALNNGKTILATNTSSIPITHIASALQFPQQCVGLHFFNPATLMRLVEVIVGISTSPDVAETMKSFATSLQKSVVMVKDSPGFIVNRVARHYYVEALKLLEEGMTTHEQIDALLKSAGFKMGPFELMDLIGIDINFAVTSSLYQSFYHEVRFRPSRIQAQKIMAKQLGRKTGKGFYNYD